MRLLIASQDWDYRFARPQQFAQIFREQHDVTYLSTGPGIIGRLRDVYHRAAPWRPPAFRIPPRLLVCCAGYLRDREDPSFITRNCRDNARTFRLMTLGAATPDILIVTNPYHYPIVARLPHRRLVYDCLDRYEDFYPVGSALREFVVANERRLIREADIVFASSRQLQQDKAQTRPVHYLPHGVEVDYFRQHTAPAPAELIDITGPVVGFVGAIEAWLNYDWLLAAAREMPEVAFVMLGDVRVDITRCRAQPNIRFLGYRPYREVPRYIARYDVCIIPFQINELTAAVNPVKTLDYFALGKPCVSSYMPELESYLPHITLARTETEFVAGIRRALQADDEGSRAARLQFARDRSWRRVAEAFLAVVDGRTETTPF